MREHIVGDRNPYVYAKQRTEERAPKTNYRLQMLIENMYVQIKRVASIAIDNTAMAR